ncbi:Uncharacterized protein HZ326_4126 [Fusarium oxysporum f. sp. albedinis]|nr:Uncharacterized protein HZ326_4126 [Fusarium oxysporum f. sp. albedinis]
MKGGEYPHIEGASLFEAWDHALCPKAYLHLLDESVVCGAIIRRYATLYSDYRGFAALLVMAMDYIGKDFHILHWE